MTRTPAVFLATLLLIALATTFAHDAREQLAIAGMLMVLGAAFALRTSGRPRRKD
jgi:hypothetical protein